MNLDEILNPRTIRAQTQKIWDDALAGHTHFKVNMDKMPSVINLVEELTRKNYPDGKIPVHGRYEHLRAGEIDRIADCVDLLRALSADQRACALFDLVVVSVFLDAGSGPTWSYTDHGKKYTRSEGLAVASYNLFKNGFFSSDHAHEPLRVDSERLKRITVSELKQELQVSATNPLDGLEGRARLLNHLGEALEANSDIFSAPVNASVNAVRFRPGNCILSLKKFAVEGKLPAEKLLKTLLIGFSKMWPLRHAVDGVVFGDVWKYKLASGEEILVPFHKLTQWLCYSLLEPIEESGLKITEIEKLTGLPEYRNGGLFLDSGVLTLKDSSALGKRFEPSQAIIIEWRALTVQLLDLVAAEMHLPLPQVLQGGTWSACRVLAAKLRPGGVPPFNIESDGTVF